MTETAETTQAQPTHNDDLFPSEQKQSTGWTSGIAPRVIGTGLLILGLIVTVFVAHWAFRVQGLGRIGDKLQQQKEMIRRFNQQKQ